MNVEVSPHNLHSVLQERFHKTIRRLFFVGIGGSSMSGLAETAMNLGGNIGHPLLCETPAIRPDDIISNSDIIGEGIHH